MAKKKEKKMSDPKDLDFDFSDIGGKVVPPEEEKSTKTVKKEKKEDPVRVLDDYQLTIPRSGGKFEFVSMRHCSNEEFRDWALSVFPEVSVDLESFESYDQRLRGLKQILRWHTETFQPLRRNQPKSRSNN